MRRTILTKWKQRDRAAPPGRGLPRPRRAPSPARADLADADRGSTEARTSQETGTTGAGAAAARGHPDRAPRELGRPDRQLLRRSPFALFRRLSDDMDRSLRGSQGSATSDPSGTVPAAHRRRGAVRTASSSGQTSRAAGRRTSTSTSRTTALSSRANAGPARGDAGGIRRSERSYGSFRRVIALPRARSRGRRRALRNGVLEISVPLQQQSRTGASTSAPAAAQARSRARRVRTGGPDSMRHWRGHGSSGPSPDATLAPYVARTGRFLTAEWRSAFAETTCPRASASLSRPRSPRPASSALASSSTWSIDLAVDLRHLETSPRCSRRGPSSPPPARWAAPSPPSPSHPGAGAGPRPSPLRARGPARPAHRRGESLRAVSQRVAGLGPRAAAGGGRAPRRRRR
jgi:hypothetical protein